ncbi:iron-containing alcohol dehydrogenase [Alkalimarinus alittae]|uniref:Iron-containing alcohol dehydrogenase n=1 Tax=Alkalimarinus alittae TaxID=2961619 RepID=A0ABY6N3M8_9ALTE|nr:iron-containing alcohol dehydrogenase [Alkalimarinus alittae]UZE96622.1 iron-containing alcohol dehydrogenase [Alkalimarinus alittae]
MEQRLDLTTPDDIQGNWNYPTTIRMGSGRLSELPFVCKSLGIRNPLLVTDAGLVAQPFVVRAMAYVQAEGSNIGLFSDIKPNPTGANIEAGVATYKAGNHDGVIALGGGSALDAGKAIALMSGQTHSIWALEDVGTNWLRADPDGIAPIVAIPTTSGTGSEVGRASVILDEENHVKKIIFHPKMMPQVVLADPELVVGLPAHLTAATGVDALVHCLEAYCAPGYHPMADGIALEGMRLIKEWLVPAVEDGSNLTARSHMMVASSMGATAFQKGLGGVHALAHPLGALFDAHHGLLNAIILPYVLVRNRLAIESRIEHVATCIGLEDKTFDGFMAWVIDLRKTLKIPHALSEIGITAERSELVGEMAAVDPSAGGNPIPLTAEDYGILFSTAVAGIGFVV